REGGDRPRHPRAHGDRRAPARSTAVRQKQSEGVSRLVAGAARSFPSPREAGRGWPERSEGRARGKQSRDAELRACRPRLVSPLTRLAPSALAALSPLRGARVSLAAQHVQACVEESHRRLANLLMDAGARSTPGASMQACGNSFRPASLHSLTKMSWSTRPGMTCSSARSAYRAANSAFSAGGAWVSAAPTVM